MIHDETEYYRSVLDNLKGGFLSVDLAGGIVYVNPTAGKILKLPDVLKLFGKYYGTALAAYPTVMAVIKDALHTHQTVHRAELQILHADTPMILGYSTLQVKNRQGEYLGIGLIFQDLTVVQRKGS